LRAPARGKKRSSGGSGSSGWNAPLADAVPLTVLSDVVAVLPGTDPLPHASLLAMAAGKPIVGFEPGGLVAAVAPDNRPFIVQTGDTQALNEALVQLTIDDYLCRRTGEANRERAMAERDRAAMIAAYRRLYASAMGRDAL
jgi:L-malate glycosyltransferase